MTISLVNQAVGAVDATNNTTFNYSASAGNFLVVFAGRSGGTATGAMTGVTDSASQTWTLATRGSVSGIQYSRIECWYIANTQAITSITLQSSTSQIYDWNVSEWSGVEDSSVLDVYSPDNSGMGSSGTTVLTPEITSTNANDLILAAFHCSGTDSTTKDTSAFTSLTAFDHTTLATGEAAYRIVSSTGNYNCQWTLGASHQAGYITVAFKAVAGLFVDVDPATESDVAQGITRGAIPWQSETDTAQAITADLTTPEIEVNVGLASDTNSAQSASAIRTWNINVGLAWRRAGL